MSLLNLQAEFIDNILSGDIVAAPTTPDCNMQIYANHIESNMVDALKSAYPMTVLILGETFFTIAAKEYVAHYPSRSPDLYDYGEYFDSFIAEFGPAREFVYLQEIARFEWACHHIYFAADSVSLDSNKLKLISDTDYDKLHFSLNPACRVERFMYPVLDIIDLCNGERDENVDLDNGGINLLIIRRDEEIKLVTLNDAEFVMLSHLQDNMPLAVALEEALAVDETFNLGIALPGWIKGNIIVDCQLIEVTTNCH